MKINLNKLLNKVILIFLMFFSLKSFSCSCGSMKLEEKILKYDYIARVKVTKSKIPKDYLDSFDPYSVNIETIEQYYGNKINEINLNSMSDSNCGIYLAKDSEWIIFGNYKNNKLYTSLCSGNYHLNKIIDSIKYENYYKNYPIQMEVIENVLRNINFNKLRKSKKTLIQISPNDKNFPYILEKLSLIKTKNRFGLFKVYTDSTKKIIKVKIINGFGFKMDKILKLELKGTKWRFNNFSFDQPVNNFNESLLLIYNIPTEGDKKKYYFSFY